MNKLLWQLRWLVERFNDRVFAWLGYVPARKLESEQRAHQLAVEAAVQAHARADELEVELRRGSQIREDLIAGTQLAHRRADRAEAELRELRRLHPGTDRRKAEDAPRTGWHDRRGPGGGGPR